MGIYITIFMIASFLSFLEFSPMEKFGKFLSVLFSIFLILFIGLRYEVGADWFPYADIIYPRYDNISFMKIFQFADPGYGFLNYLANKFDLSVAYVNLICALIFIAGFKKFTESFTKLNTAYLIALPYIIIVMSMNYSRQSTALGLVFFALFFLINHRILLFGIFIILAASFHKSSFLFMPFFLIHYRDSKFFVFMVILAMPFLAYAILNLFFEAMIAEYLGGDYGSSGATIRLFVNFLAGITYLLMKKNFYFSEREQILFNFLAIGSILIFLFHIALPFSTFFDRIGLYFSIIQVIAFANIIHLVRPRPLGYMVIMPAYFFMLYYWLSESTYAQSWIPYSFSL